MTKCNTCRKPFDPYWHGTTLHQDVCRECHQRARRRSAERVERESRRGPKSTVSQHATVPVDSLKPAHVRGMYPHTLEWYVAQQEAFVRHMAKLGIEERKAPEPEYRAAGDRPTMGLGARF